MRSQNMRSSIWDRISIIQTLAFIIWGRISIIQALAFTATGMIANMTDFAEDKMHCLDYDWAEDAIARALVVPSI